MFWVRTDSATLAPPAARMRSGSWCDGAVTGGPEHEANPRELERLAIALARDAAGFVRERRVTGWTVQTKSTTTDLVTEVDRATETRLREAIRLARPADSVLGEEGGAAGGEAGVRWVLDPIDGTVNFVLGLPQYAVSVGAEVDGVAVAGAVCNVATGETFHARRGGGAYLDGQRLTGPRRVDLARAVIGTGFGYDRARRAAQALVVAAVLERVADIRRMGAASLDLCAVAAGRLDGYFEAGLNRWDYSAGALIAAEAGCAVSGPGGHDAEAGELLVATHPELAEELIATLSELGADAV